MSARAAAPPAGQVAPGAGSGSLLVVIEPAGAPSLDTGAMLAAEATRLAAELGVRIQSVTWTPLPDIEPDAVAAAVAVAAERSCPAAVLLADTDLGRQLAPLVARRLGSGAVVGCSDVLVYRHGGGSRLSFVKPVYGGWLEQELSAVNGSIPVATVDLTGRPEPEPGLEVVTAPEVLEPERVETPAVRSLEVIPPDPSTVDLIHARRIVTAGAGTEGDELLTSARELAELLDGSLGATRPVVDDGRLPEERLIGRTGRTVTPDLYVALGVSGSPHHVVGVAGAETVISVNRDPGAAIFRFSDVGYVGDLKAVLPALVQRIKEYRDAAGSGS